MNTEFIDKWEKILSGCYRSESDYPANYNEDTVKANLGELVREVLTSTKDERITGLLQANNALVERARNAEHIIDQIEKKILEALK